MKTRMICFLVVVLSALLLVPAAGRSDGMFFMATETGEYADFDAQRAVLLINEDESYSLFIQVNYTGKPAGFSWVLPLPALPDDYDVAQQQFFDDMDAFTAPRFFEETTCEHHYCSSQSADVAYDAGGIPGTQVGSDITVWSSEKVGLYETAIISGENPEPLVAWLEEREFTFPEEAVDIFGQYIDDGFFFFVAKIDMDEAPADGEVANLSPLRFDFPAGTQVLYPMKLTRFSLVEQLPILVYVVDLGNRKWVPSTYAYEINTETDMNLEQYKAFVDILFEDNPDGILLVQYFGGLYDFCPSDFGYYPVYVSPRSVRQIIGDDVSDMFEQLITAGDPITTAVRYYGRFAPNAMVEDIIFAQAEEGAALGQSADDFLKECEEHVYIDDCPPSPSSGSGCSVMGSLVF